MESANEVRVSYDREDPNGDDQFLAADSVDPLTGYDIQPFALVVETVKTIEIFPWPVIEKAVIVK